MTVPAVTNDAQATRTGTKGARLSPDLRILVVDDHCVVRAGIETLLERQIGMKVVGSVASGEEAIRGARRLRPDVIIMDLVLPDFDGIDATGRILSEFPFTRIIALSACRTLEHVRRAIRAGVQGYVLKADAGDELVRAVNAAVAGQRYLSPAIAPLLNDGLLDPSLPKSPYESLSIRERQVLRCVVSGASSADIALTLSLSRKTIDTYRSRMMLKLGVANRSALIRFAIEHEMTSV
ncbi:MAG TPA: response regulator transcription factor [Steroidobacteraceae bacterium]